MNIESYNKVYMCPLPLSTAHIDAEAAVFITFPRFLNGRCFDTLTWDLSPAAGDS